LPFDEENDPFGRTLEDFTLTGKLRRFHEDFDSSIRAILQDCLFRIQEGKRRPHFPNSLPKRSNPKAPVCQKREDSQYPKMDLG
jgi:hypothetical protein